MTEIAEPQKPSAPIQLFELIGRNHKNESWRDINPMYARTLSLAIEARLTFALTDFAEIVKRYGGYHWLGEDAEERWYSSVVRTGEQSAILTVEHWLGRTPFILDGERVYVGKQIQWEGDWYICTSIEPDFIRAKCQQHGKPETVREIPRAGFEDRIAAQKAAAKAEREAAKEAGRADPIELPTIAEHLAYLQKRGEREYLHHFYMPHHEAAPLVACGADFQAAWKAATNGYTLCKWVVALGLYKNDGPGGDADAIRKKVSWPRVQQALYRITRQSRGLPLKDVKEST